MFVGRGFSRDIRSPFSSGVSTPEGSKLHFSAACFGAEVDFDCGIASGAKAQVFGRSNVTAEAATHKDHLCDKCS
jgi:hypothetical protein